MTLLQWHKARLALHGSQTLFIPDLELAPQACWAFVGSNGSGKTALASALCGELAVRAGAVSGRVWGSWTGSGAIPTCWGKRRRRGIGYRP